ncbi:hypothetical protein FRB95_003514 [Tulasnella sp. JGI-2019a]|nr:hypothetical protein FRB95_003514 [Tulasnella sp. JGI-2019a]
MPQQPLYADYKDREFQLPALVESQRQGWIFSAQAAAVVSVLFCGAETQLIATIKGDTPPEGAAGAYKFLLLLSYAAFLLNASATIASLLMIDRPSWATILVEPFRKASLSFYRASNWAPEFHISDLECLVDLSWPHHRWTHYMMQVTGLVSAAF